MYIIHIDANLNESTVSTHWEPASNVSPSLIQEYEATVNADIAVNADIVDSQTSGGQTIHTVSTGHYGSPKSKKARIACEEISDTDSGYVL